MKFQTQKALPTPYRIARQKLGIRLAFDHVGRTALNTTVAERNKSLQIYDTIADVYKALQGFGTDKFDCMDRTSQNKEKSRHGYFQYRIDFKTEFEDLTAEK